MAELITAEIGAPISFAKRAQVRIPLMMFSAFAGLAAAYPWRESRPGCTADVTSANNRWAW